MKKLLLLGYIFAIFSIAFTATGYAQQQKTNALQNAAASDGFYIGQMTAAVGQIYTSQLSSSTLSASSTASAITSSFEGYLIEGTTDDDGNWWAVKHNDYRDYICKINKTTGAVLFQIESPYGTSISSMAYNPVDKLIYVYLRELMRPASNKSVNDIAGINYQLGSWLYTCNPATSVFAKVADIDANLANLACSSDGVFYSVIKVNSKYSLVKFTAGSWEVQTIGISQVSNFFKPSGFLDLEINRNTNKCYLLTENSENAGITELREVNLTTGTTSLLHSYGTSTFIAGLAFDYAATPVVTPSNGKYVITSPNGGNKLTGGSYNYINWSKTGGTVSGSIQLEYTTDGGSVWTKINKTPISGLVRYNWSVPKVNSSHCLIRMSNYVTHKVFDVSNKEFSIVSTVSAKNYPNPFNPSTKIVFGLENNAQVSLKVFNSIGQQVAELVNGQLEAGTHEYEFNGASLTSGVYFYNLSVDGQSQVNKMLLMK